MALTRHDAGALTVLGAPGRVLCLRGSPEALSPTGIERSRRTLQDVTDVRTPGDIHLIGPGGAGKSTIGALLAERLHVPFFDLDRELAGRVGDISAFIGQHGYEMYARENVEMYCSISHGRRAPGVIALSSGFMTYPSDIHPDYSRLRRDLEHNPATFVLLPSLDRDVCVTETVRRQIARPFGRSPLAEEAVIRARFDIYLAMPMRKIETLRPPAAAVAEIVAAVATLE